MEPENIALLWSVMRFVKEKYPYELSGYVFLPDHLHLLLKPEPSISLSKIMGSIKWNFTMEFKKAQNISEPFHFWQRRFHDRVVRNADEFWTRLRYIHWNPVKHEYVAKPEMWPHSSVHFWRSVPSARKRMLATGYP
jgi:putative transposase